MPDGFRKRRVLTIFLSFVLVIFIIAINSPIQSQQRVERKKQSINSSLAIESLKKLSVKGRAPKTDYTREQFGSGWASIKGCDTRNIILNRDFINPIVDSNCNVTSGTLNDPYSGKTIQFKRGSETSSAVQIDHVVALSDAWQKGAQQLEKSKRVELANDPLELIAVDGASNQQKADGDAATWLPSNKSFRCQYVARQIAVKTKYNLWVTQAEHDAINNILNKCPEQMLPSP